MNNQEIIKWNLDRVYNKLVDGFIINIVISLFFFLLTLYAIVSGIARIDERIEKLQDSISVMSEPPQKIKAQLYLEKFGDYEFPPACDPLDE